jgi:hypothetical protein
VRGKGITYDTGFFRAGSTASTREVFDPEVVGRELAIIRRDLHCNAVRVTGGDPDRLEVAARHAAEAGLEVWWSPFTCDLTAGELLDLLGDCAERAERLRRQGAEVVLLTGSELSLFTVGFLPGDRLEDRLGLLATPGRLGELLAEVAGASATTSAPSSPRRRRRESRPRSPGSAAPPTAGPPTWAAVATPSSNGTTTADRGGCGATIAATRPNRRPTCGRCWPSWTPRGSTPRS